MYSEMPPTLSPQRDVREINGSRTGLRESSLEISLDVFCPVGSV